MKPHAAPSTPLRDLTERDLTHQVVQLAQTLGWLRYHTWRSKHSAAGYPDGTLVRDRVIFLELKTERRRNEETTEPERQFEETAPAEEEPAQPPEPEPKPDPDGRALFDAAGYADPELAVPKIDGLAVDELKIAFSGTIELDRTSRADCALYRRISDGRRPMPARGHEA